MTTDHTADGPHFIYVGDPLCSWCWGFAPVLEQMGERYPFPVRVVVGGLRPGPAAHEVDEDFRRFLVEHWEHVEEASGQPCDPAVLRDGLVYDTEPPCRAVVAVREVNPAETLRWFARLQRAFYAEGVEVTDPTTVPALLEGFDVAPEAFVEAFQAETTRERTWRDFREARELGVTGFPTLFFHDGERVVELIHGFVPWEQLEPPLTAWLTDRGLLPAREARTG